jgi:hypothetical protein
LTEQFTVDLKEKINLQTENENSKSNNIPNDKVLMDINLKIIQNKDSLNRLQEENNTINSNLNELKEKFDELLTNFSSNMEHAK